MIISIISVLAIATILALVVFTPHDMMNHPQVTSEEIFIAEMLPHHQEAVDSSQLMLESQNSQVKALAESIISAQEKEINMMRSWMNDWYSNTNYVRTYQNMMPNLVSLEGEARDEAYLKGMIDHHQGAIQMAKQAQGLNLRPEVRQLTDDIISTQNKEITQINQMLKNS